MHLVNGTQATRIRRIGCWRVDGELLGYLQAHLQASWPGVELRRVAAVADLQQLIVDAWLLGETPPSPPSAPALILGPLQRIESIETLADRLHRISSPITGRRMLAELQAALRGRESG